MGVGFCVKFRWYIVGTSTFLYSFFSTIAYNLENSMWGDKFPVIMNELYQGKLQAENVDKAIIEVENIRTQLKKFSPSNVVWDIDDLSLQPPWGDDISDDITDLSNYFITSDGEDLIEVLIEALTRAKKFNVPVEIISM